MGHQSFSHTTTKHPEYKRQYVQVNQKRKKLIALSLSSKYPSAAKSTVRNIYKFKEGKSFYWRKNFSQCGADQDYYH